MPYDPNDQYPRLDDGVYIENISNTILLADSIIVKSTVKLPTSFKNKYWNVTGESRKARWIDITFNNGNVLNNNSNIVVNDFIEFKCDIRLSSFHKLTKLLVNTTGTFSIFWYDSNHANETELNNNIDLTSLNLTSETFYLRIVKTGSNLTLNSIDISIVTLKKNTEDDFLINAENITNLNNLFNTQFDTMYPVGIVIEMDNDTDPNNTMRGSWELFAKGQFTVGRNPNDTDFNTRGKTGGAKTHTLTVNEIPGHNHLQNPHGHTGSTSSSGSHVHTYKVYDTTGSTRQLTSSGTSVGNANAMTSGEGLHTHTITINSTTATNQNTGGDQAHNNIPPYVVVNKWKRVA